MNNIFDSVRRIESIISRPLETKIKNKKELHTIARKFNLYKVYKIQNIIADKILEDVWDILGLYSDLDSSTEK